MGDCLMILTGIPKVCPVHHHFRSLISFFSRSCLVLSHSVVVKVVRPFEIQYSAQVSVDESLYRFQCFYFIIVSNSFSPSYQINYSNIVQVNDHILFKR